MDDILFGKVRQSGEDIFDEGLCGFLCEVMSFSEFGLEIALVTEFGDNVTISIAGEYFETSKDVWMVELFQYVYFGEEQLL